MRNPAKELQLVCFRISPLGAVHAIVCSAIASAPDEDCVEAFILVLRSVVRFAEV